MKNASPAKPGKRRYLGIRSMAAAGAVLVVAISTAACSSSGNTAATPGAPSHTTLRFASYGPPLLTWDPHLDGRPASNVDLFAVYDRLIGEDPSGKLIPQLATEWKFTDSTTLDMTLRSGVKFQDGTDFNGAAVKANIEREKGINNGAGPWAGPLAPVTSVEVVDQTHVRFHLKTPSASLPSLLADAAGAMISPAAFFSDLANKPVGAGMYTLTSWTKDGGATYERFADYWDKSATGPQTIQMSYQLDQLRRLDMLKSGEVDATFGHTTFVAGAKDAGLNVTGTPGINVWFIDLNQTKAPFDDANVRKAINYALDQKALIKALLGGEADANDQPFNPQSAGYSSTLGKDVFPTDVAKAKSLVAASKYASGVTFDCAIIPGSGGAYAQYAEVVKAQLAQAGITMNIKQVTSQSAALLIDKSVNCAILPYAALDPVLMAKQLFAADGYYNAGKTATPEMTALLTALDQPQSDADLKANFQKLDQMIADQGLFSSLFFENWAVLANPDVVEGMQFYLGGYYTEFRNLTMK